MKKIKLIMSSMLLLLPSILMAQSLENYRVKNPCIFSLEMNLNGVRKQIRGESNLSSAAMGGLFGIFVNQIRTVANPTAYIVVNVKGKGSFIVADRIKEVDGRKTLVSFAAPQDWEDSDAVIDVWLDNSQSDQFWKVVLSSITVDGNANVRAETHPVVPIKISGDVGIKATMSIDYERLGDVKLVSDKFVGQWVGKIPKSNLANEGKVTGEDTSVVSRPKIEIGTAILENLGRAN